MPPKTPPDVPGGFDDEDQATLREVIAEYRRRKAFRETVGTWVKYILAASGALIAIAQLRGFFRDLLK